MSQVVSASQQSIHVTIVSLTGFGIDSFRYGIWGTRDLLWRQWTSTRDWGGLWTLWMVFLGKLWRVEPKRLSRLAWSARNSTHRTRGGKHTTIRHTRTLEHYSHAQGITRPRVQLIPSPAPIPPRPRGKCGIQFERLGQQTSEMNSDLNVWDNKLQK